MIDGKIYKITNIVTGKIYIGQTRNDPNKRLRDHQYDSGALRNSMIKYGIKNFIIEILARCDNYNTLNFIETALIEQYQSMNKLKGYNILVGGGCGKMTDDHRRKLSESQKGIQAKEKHPL